MPLLPFQHNLSRNFLSTGSPGCIKLSLSCLCGYLICAIVYLCLLADPDRWDQEAPGSGSVGHPKYGPHRGRFCLLFSAGCCISSGRCCWLSKVGSQVQLAPGCWHQEPRLNRHHVHLSSVAAKEQDDAMGNSKHTVMTL